MINYYLITNILTITIKPKYKLNELYYKNKNKIYWPYLSSNLNTIHILENNLDKINWANLSRNPNAIHILENNLDKVNWDALSKNPNGIHILENNLDKIYWWSLSINPNINYLIYKLKILSSFNSFNNYL